MRKYLLKHVLYPLLMLQLFRVVFYALLALCMQVYYYFSIFLCKNLVIIEIFLHVLCSISLIAVLHLTR